MIDFKENQKREEYMWNKYSNTIKKSLTRNNSNASIERISGMLDFDCGIDAVVKLPYKKSYSIRFISLRILKNNYNNFTFRIPDSKFKSELFKLTDTFNPSPYYHIQITEGNNGTQIAILNLHKFSEYVIENPVFWFKIMEYRVKGKRNDFYSIPITKFKRFIKIVHIK
jgi:hypothetical protein